MDKSVLIYKKDVKFCATCFLCILLCKYVLSTTGV